MRRRATRIHRHKNTYCIRIYYTAVCVRVLMLVWLAGEMRGVARCPLLCVGPASRALIDMQTAFRCLCDAASAHDAPTTSSRRVVSSSHVVVRAKCVSQANYRKPAPWGRIAEPSCVHVGSACFRRSTQLRSSVMRGHGGARARRRILLHAILTVVGRRSTSSGKCATTLRTCALYLQCCALYAYPA